MATRSLNVAITGDARSLNKVLADTESRTKRSMGAIGKSFAVAGAAAAGGLAVGLKKSAEAAIEAEKSQARMVTQLKAAGVSYRAHASEIDRVIQKHSQLSGLDDEELQDAFTNIVRITGDVDKGLRLTGLAADFARAKHMDVAKAGELVAKVAGGNTGILSRYGIQIEKGATATEALGILQQKFAGQAESYGKTTAGAMDRASVASENLSEIVGSRLTPWLAKGATALVNLVDKAGQLAGPIRKASGAVRDAYESMSAAVRRFVNRNRSDIDSVIAAVRNLQRAAVYVFKEILVPVLRTAATAIGRILGNVVQIIRGMIRIVSGILTGDWSKAWNGAKDVAAGALKGVFNIMRGSAEILLRLAVALGRQIIRGLVAGLKGLAGAIKDAVVNGVRAGVGAAKGAVNDIIGKINPFGDGIGRAAKNIAGDGLGFMGGSAGGSGAGLMGADFDLGPFARIGAGMGLRTTSGLRPGSVTSSGNPSFHGTGDAIDMSGPPSAMMRFARTMKGMFGSRLRELIYTPMGAGIKDGRPFQYSGQVAADHYDHVHVAYTGPFGDGIGDIRNLWTRAGGSAAKANLAAAVAMAESGGDPRAFNTNADGSVDRGLWQINSVHGGLSTFDRLGNARAAVRISGGGRNWNPWVAFTNGSYRRFLSSGGGSGGGGRARSRPMSPAEAFRQSQENTLVRRGVALRAAGRGLRRPRTGPGKGVDRGEGLADGDPGLLGAPVEAVSDPAAEALAAAIEASTRATEEHTAALRGVEAEMKRQTDIAQQYASTSEFQKTKFIADIFSGQFGRGIIGRSFTPGTGVEYAY